MEANRIVTRVNAILLFISIVWFLMKWQDITPFQRLLIFVLLCIFTAISLLSYYATDMYDYIMSLTGRWKNLGGLFDRAEGDILGRLRKLF